jgi:hypothetical protein
MAFPDRRTMSVLLTTLLFGVALAIVYIAAPSTRDAVVKSLLSWVSALLERRYAERRLSS